MLVTFPVLTFGNCVLKTWVIKRPLKLYAHFLTFFPKCQISRRFLAKNARFHGNFTEGYLLFFEPPKIIYMHWYIRPICVTSKLVKAINVKNVTNGHFTVHWLADRLTAYQVARSHVQLHVASADYKLLMATVQTYRPRPTGIALSPPLPYKTSTKTVASPKPATVSSVYQWQLQVSLLNYSQSSSSWQWWLDSPEYTLTWTDVERYWQLCTGWHFVLLPRSASRLMTAEQ